MAQHDYDIANAAGLAFRQDLNLVLAAILSSNSGASEPASTAAYMIWADTSAGLIKMRNAADSAWVNLGAIDGFIASQAAVNAGLVTDKFVTPETLAATTLSSALTAAVATKHGVLNVKVIDIGDWDMDATSNVSVTHGLSMTKIRSITGVIRNDADTQMYNLPYVSFSTDEVDAEIGNIDSTLVGLTRRALGTFDSTFFNSISYNRGWITIFYVD